MTFGSNELIAIGKKVKINSELLADDESIIHGGNKNKYIYIIRKYLRLMLFLFKNRYYH